MICLVVKFKTKPEWTQRWQELVRPFTDATRAEEGNLWFEWSQSLEHPEEYVLLEAFRDDDAGTAHLESAHFRTAIHVMQKALAAAPKLIRMTIDASDWSETGEVAVSDRHGQPTRSCNDHPTKGRT
jgi:quinol monooxygenase YgiN